MHHDADFPYTFSLPSEFVRVDLDTRASALRMSEQLSNAGIPEDQVSHALVHQEYMLVSLLENDVLYAATFLGRSSVDPSALTAALFTVAQTHVPELRENSLDAMLTAAEGEPDTEALEVQLTVGPALAVTQQSLVHITQAVSGRPLDRNQEVRQLQVMFPNAENKTLTTFSLSTEFVRDWNDYTLMMAEIMKTIDLRVPASTVQQRLRGL
jgi:hypothetical protein